MDDKQKYALQVNEFMKNRKSTERLGLDNYGLRDWIRIQLLNRLNDDFGYYGGADGGLGIYVHSLLSDVNMDHYIDELIRAIERANIENLPSANESILWQMEEKAKREAHAKTIEK